MGFLGKLFGKSGAPTTRPGPPQEQAVLVYLDGTSLPDAIYEANDLETLEDRLVATLSRAGTGEFDGNEIGPTETKLFLYGPDAEALFRSVEEVLRSYPLCQNARVVLRRGGPGAPEQEIRLPGP
jgi:hypothetical protein